MPGSLANVDHMCLIFAHGCTCLCSFPGGKVDSVGIGIRTALWAAQAIFINRRLAKPKTLRLGRQNLPCSGSP